MFLELIKEIHELLKQGKCFKVLQEDGHLFVIKKKTRYTEEIKSALVVFNACIKYLRYQVVDSEGGLLDQLQKMHELWMKRLTHKTEPLSDKLCELMLYSELLRFNGKISLFEWINFQEDAFFQESDLLSRAVNYSIDLGSFFLVELNSGARLRAPINELQKKSRYSKRGTKIGYDLYFDQILILSFNKKGQVLKSCNVSNGVIRSLHG